MAHYNWDGPHLAYCIIWDNNSFQYEDLINNVATLKECKYIVEDYYLEGCIWMWILYFQESNIVLVGLVLPCLSL